MLFLSLTLNKTKLLKINNFKHLYDFHNVSLQLKKLQDNVNKRKDEVNKTREKYQVALQDINNYNAKYMEEMTNVFEECQRKEAQRLQEFKDILFAAQKCLNVSEDPE